MGGTKMGVTQSETLKALFMFYTQRVTESRDDGHSGWAKGGTSEDGPTRGGERSPPPPFDD